jgi:ribosomal protein L11 methyltransferase
MSAAALTLWRAGFSVPRRLAEAFAAALEDEAESVAAFEEGLPDASAETASWRIETLHREEREARRLGGLVAAIAEQHAIEPPPLAIEPVPAADWIAASRFPPSRAGRFLVRGSHLGEPPPPDAIAIRIDPGLAFGSGEHATTRACLLALDALSRRRRLRRVLDLGTGSGVLAIAAARVWPARVLATDNDPLAVQVARENLRANGVEGRVAVIETDGLKDPRVARAGRFDLILANLLADLLIDLAPDIAARLEPDGVVVLSGLLGRQAPAVRDAFRRRGLAPQRALAIGPWSTLVMTARGRRRWGRRWGRRRGRR